MADEVSLERVEAGRVVEELVGQVVEVWSAAHGLSSASSTRREFGTTRIPRHARRAVLDEVGAGGDRRRPGDRGRGHDERDGDDDGQANPHEAQAY